MQRSYAVTISLAKILDTVSLTYGSPYIYKRHEIFERFDDGFVVRVMTLEDTRIVLNWYCSIGVVSPVDVRIAHLATTDNFSLMVGDCSGFECSSGATYVEFDKILEYDNERLVVPNCPNRRAFLQQWLNVEGGLAFVVLDNKNNLALLGQRRPCYQEKRGSKFV